MSERHARYRPAVCVIFLYAAVETKSISYIKETEKALCLAHFFLYFSFLFSLFKSNLTVSVCRWQLFSLRF